MPILPENKSKYPKNWNEISLATRKKYGWLCGVCGISNYSVGYRDSKGIFNRTYGNKLHDEAGNGELTYKKAKDFADYCNESLEEDYKYIVIVLTVAHLDHNPENCNEDNLKPMCQRCHNIYDRNHRDQTKKTKKNQLSLFSNQ